MVKRIRTALAAAIVSINLYRKINEYSALSRRYYYTVIIRVPPTTRRLEASQYCMQHGKG